MKVGVLIPFVHDFYLTGILDSIQKNSLLPDVVLLLDNSPDNIVIDISRYSFTLSWYKSHPPLWVNASWNYGIDKLSVEVDLISVLNDDLVLEKYFFEKLLKLADKNKNYSVFCPQTVPKLNDLDVPILPDMAYCDRMDRREGWAWTIRSSVAKQIPQIPPELKTWCGDDWMFRHCMKLGRPWAKMINNFCYHYVGGSNVKMNVRKDLRREKNIFKELIL